MSNEVKVRNYLRRLIFLNHPRAFLHNLLLLYFLNENFIRICNPHLLHISQKTVTKLFRIYEANTIWLGIVVLHSSMYFQNFIEFISDRL